MEFTVADDDRKSESAYRKAEVLFFGGDTFAHIWFWTPYCQSCYIFGRGALPPWTSQQGYCPCTLPGPRQPLGFGKCLFPQHDKPTWTERGLLLTAWWSYAQGTCQWKLVILRDFNARVSSITQHGLALLVNMVSVKRTQMANFCFHYARSTVSKSQTHSSTWTMLTKPPGCIQDQSTGIRDFIICRKYDLCDFHITRAMRGAECSTDHLLLRSKVNLQVQRKRRPQGKIPPRKMNVQEINNSVALQNEFCKCLEQVAFIKWKTEENWAKLKHEVDTAAKQTIDVLKRHHQDWFDDNNFEIQGLLAEKYVAHKNWLADKQPDFKRDKFNHFRRKVEKRLHFMRDEWLKKNAEEIQDCVDLNNAKLFYSSLREVYKPPQRSAAPNQNLQGELLTDNEAINRRWVERLKHLLPGLHRLTAMLSKRSQEDHYTWNSWPTHNGWSERSNWWVAVW